MRTLVLGAFAALAAFWSWYFYDRSTEHARELEAREVRIGALEDDLDAVRGQLSDAEETIEEQGVELERRAREIERLEVSMHLLKVDHRVARVEVLSQETNPDDPEEVTTTVRFSELGSNGEPIGEGVVVTLKGKKLYVEGLVLKFDDDYVEQGDYLRGTSICLFRSIFSENQAPSEAHQIDPKNAHPLPYQGDDVGDPFYDELWSKFWDYANDPEAAAAKGVRAAHGEAPFVEARPGKVYRVELRQSGGLSITPEN